MDDDIIILTCSTVILTSVLVAYNAMSKRKRRHSVWVRGYLKDRDKYGAYNCLMRDFRVSPVKWSGFKERGMQQCILSTVMCNPLWSNIGYSWAKLYIKLGCHQLSDESWKVCEILERFMTYKSLPAELCKFQYPHVQKRAGTSCPLIYILYHQYMQVIVKAMAHSDNLNRPTL
jgi:hypothetical protein